MNTPAIEKIKKPRAAARVWKQFRHLSRGDIFFIGKTRMEKRGILSAAISSTGDKRFMYPLRRVQTDELVVTKKSVRAHVATIDSLYQDNVKPFVPLADPGFRGPVSQPNTDNAITGTSS
ncbi:MAG: hypothetical protein HOO67_05550 [Candidatus Peribacteraceae bacterium]|nr:hypothetical protein [Candidatus Peribacteraceae bacterium]